jgi:predicted small metal-binding protein
VCFVCGCGFDVDYNDEEEVEDVCVYTYINNIFTYNTI